jgi:hypothetical protein
MNELKPTISQKTSLKINTSLVRVFYQSGVAAGYVGIEYFGGNRIGQHVRGGGGRAHRAFCFWDILTVMKFRVEHHPLPKLQGLNVRSLPTEYRTTALDNQGHPYSGVVKVK